MNPRLSETFRAFADIECRETSPLYFSLAQAIAADEDILNIAGQTRAGQPVPNLLFAAVHFLLVADPSHPLTEFYATCTAEPKDPADAFPVFKDFVLRHQRDIVNLLQTRLVQTNEVRRCACLYPAFLFALRHFEPASVALLEIGCSAGLNLLWDRYRYQYEESGEEYGDLSSPVLITSEFCADRPAAIADPLPEISLRIGVDLHVIDTSISAEADWLRALVWPEHHWRRRLMDAAIERRAEVDLDLHTGDGFAMVSEIAAEIPADSLLCVYHTHVANQISQVEREEFLESIIQLGQQRDLIHLFNNLHDAKLRLQIFRDGQLIEMPVANTDSHGRWLEWLAGSD
ncbi:MAG: DUF2332 domain-containing protein [Planctomycetota bacterium]